MKTRDIRQFRRVLRRFTRLINSQLKTCCRTVTLAQCLVLMEVEEIRTPTMGQLASALRLDNSTLSRTVDGLVERGLIERVRGDADRRVVKIRLTRPGKAVCRSIHADNDASCRRVFGQIPPSQHDRVVRSFEVLVDAFLACEDQERSDPSGVPSRTSVSAASD